MRISNFLFAVFFCLPAIGNTETPCGLTPQLPLGSHFVDKFLNKVDIGQGLIIKGKVKSAVSCEPIAGAKIEHWQTSTSGFYTDELRAYLQSGDDGSYRFETEWPGAPVPHIHFIITAPGYQKLVTQWVGQQQVEQIDLDFILVQE
jgi:protocatechuate 3,4-dioxygenase beta subunit